MRLASLLLAASLSLAPGCAALAVAPAVGLASGVAVGAVVRTSDERVSLARFGLVGAAIGAVVDVVLIAAVVAAFDAPLGPSSAERR